MPTDASHAIVGLACVLSSAHAQAEKPEPPVEVFIREIIDGTTVEIVS